MQEIQTYKEETMQINEWHDRRRNGGKDTQALLQKMDILRNKKGRECDKQRASTATYDSMEINHTETYKICHRGDTTEENQHREYMETNTEQASYKNKRDTI